MSEDDFPEVEKNEFVDIDALKLDEELIAQPNLVQHYNTKLAEAKRDYERAKIQLDVARADIFLDILQNPKHFNVVRPTVSAIEAAVLIQRPYIVALEELAEKKHVIELYKATCNALEHRKKSLESLIDLYMTDYFSTPRPRSTRRMATDDSFDIRKREKRRRRRDEGDDE